MKPPTSRSGPGSDQAMRGRCKLPRFAVLLLMALCCAWFAVALLHTDHEHLAAADPPPGSPGSIPAAVREDRDDPPLRSPGPVPAAVHEYPSDHRREAPRVNIGDPAPWRIEGRVIDEASGSPASNVTIQFGLYRVQNSDLTPRAVIEEVKADSDGQFTLDVPAHINEGTIVALSVTDAYGHTILSGNAKIEKDMVILIPDSLYLHGRVTGLHHVCGAKAAYAIVYESGVQSRNLGHGQLGEDGRFGVRTWGVSKEWVVILRVGCEDRLYAVPTDVGTLASSEGLVVDLQMRAVHIHVVDDDANGIAAASVAVYSPDISANGTALRGRTNADGLVVMHLPRQIGATVAAAAPGRHMRTAELPAGGAEVDEMFIKLAMLTEKDYIRGHVYNEMGQPIEGVLVTALPALRAGMLAASMSIQQRTSHDGNFTLGVGGHGMQFEVVAFCKIHGVSGTQVVTPPKDNLVFVMPWARSLHIEAVAARTDMVSRGGEVEWILVRTEDGTELRGAETLPFLTEPVAVGNYMLALWWPEADLFGELHVAVERGDGSQQVLVELDQPNYLEGRVIAERPLDMRVRHRRKDWSAAMTKNWATVPCGPDGSFRVLAGKHTAGQVDVLDDRGAVIGRALVRVGAPPDIIVRSR